VRVVATAGHVDHGKSTLVRALTGMEPDRWAQERRRGMTIDLGYAWTTLDAAGSAEAADPVTIAFVDVPGHERFVPNMLAGLGPVPAVLFVVAADGGWMPQSAEHLAAVDALGVRHGLLAVTRADLADPGPATREARAEIAKTSLGDVPAVAVSPVTGLGLDDLRGALARLAAALPREPPDAAVRMWIDRSFTIKGSGTVVTGTLPAGTVRVGEELLLTPSGVPVRVRAIQALGSPAQTVTGVARVALNLRGVPPDVPERGMALISPGRWRLTAEIDVRMSVGARPKLPPALALHIGSARVPAKVRVLGEDGGGEDGGSTMEHGGNTMEHGGSTVYARLTLREPLPLHAGDRVLLRDPGAAGLAIYGATVLDPFPPGLRRRGAAAAAARELAAWPVVPQAADLLRRHGLLRAAVLAEAGVGGLPAPVAGDWLADSVLWARLRAELPKAVSAFAAQDPLARGMPVDAARGALGLPDRELVTALLTGPDGTGLSGQDGTGTTGAGGTGATGAGGRGRVGPGGSDRTGPGGPGLVVDGGYLRPAASVPRLPPAIARAVEAIRADLAADPFGAPDAQRLRDLGLDGKAIAAAARAGLLLRLDGNVVLGPDAAREAARILGALPQPFSTSQARQALGTSRRVAIPLLEYLDRARVTERLPGDRRRLR
jgi:selenocysteine-specific elongation factor